MQWASGVPIRGSEHLLPAPHLNGVTAPFIFTWILESTPGFSEQLTVTPHSLQTPLNLSFELILKLVLWGPKIEPPSVDTREPRYSASLLSPYWQMPRPARQLLPLWANEAVSSLSSSPCSPAGPPAPPLFLQGAAPGRQREEEGGSWEWCLPHIRTPKPTEEMFKGEMKYLRQHLTNLCFYHHPTDRHTHQKSSGQRGLAQAKGSCLLKPAHIRGRRKMQQGRKSPAPGSNPCSTAQPPRGGLDQPGTSRSLHFLIYKAEIRIPAYLRGASHGKPCTKGL